MTLMEFEINEQIRELYCYFSLSLLFFFWRVECVDLLELGPSLLPISFSVCVYVCICSRYQPIKVIGKGAYGVVCSATNAATNEAVAVKKIAGVFGNVLDARRTFREIRILRCLRHENIIAVKNVLTPRDANNFGDMYVVYELMDTDLQHIIHSKQPLSDEHCQYFIYQVCV